MDRQALQHAATIRNQQEMQCASKTAVEAAAVSETGRPHGPAFRERERKCGNTNFSSIITKRKSLMNKFIITFAITISFAMFTSNSFAQATGTALATGNIVSPISISATGGTIGFGNMAVLAGSGGTVLIDPTSSGARSVASGDVTLLKGAQSGSVSEASFTVGGEGSYTYGISLPAHVTLFCTVVGHLTESMDLVPSSYPATTGTLDAGTQVLKVGGTLTVGAAQYVGGYEAAAFDVTVNYN
jgi:hypothetical protein